MPVGKCGICGQTHYLNGPCPPRPVTKSDENVTSPVTRDVTPSLRVTKTRHISSLPINETPETVTKSDERVTERLATLEARVTALEAMLAAGKRLPLSGADRQKAYRERHK